MSKVNVELIEESALMRLVASGMLMSAPGISLFAPAINGMEGVDKGLENSSICFFTNLKIVA
tara:strand:+ start:2833 stop:3018 length:186 start_codon:yes stop_codon:yes gene_type:complete